MGKVNLIQTNFTSGEISPLMKGRVDVNRYANGAQQLLNFLVHPQGGLRRRSGTRFINEVKDTDKYTRLIPFEFSSTQTYILEFGDKYIRFYANGGLIVNGSDEAIEVVTPYSPQDLDAIQFAQSADVMFITHPNYQTRTLSRLSQVSWTLALYVTTDGPYLDTNSTDTKLKVASRTDIADVRNFSTITWAGFSSGDVDKFVPFQIDGEWLIAKIVSISVDLYTAHVNYTHVEFVKTGIDKAVRISYDGTNLVSSNSGVFGANDIGKYVRANIGSNIGKFYKITAAPNDAGTTAAASILTQITYTYPDQIFTVSNRVIAGTLTSTAAVFKSTDVGRQFRMNFSGLQLWGTITAWTSNRLVTVTFGNEVPRNPISVGEYADYGVTDNWRLGAWSETTGWPSSVTFHEQRLTFASTRTQPQTMWMSVSGDYANHAPTTLESTVLAISAITYTIVSNKVNTILWLSSGPTLLVGTIGAEWQVKAASSINEPITPTNISITPQTTHGSESHLVPVRVGSAVVFVQRSGKKEKELTYDFTQDSYISRDLTIISEHILRQGGVVKQVAYQAEPHGIIWHLLTDGTLASLTYIKEQDVLAWHRHQIGGDAIVESIACITSASGDDFLYLVARRIIGGTEKRYIEMLEVDFDRDVVLTQLASDTIETAPVDFLGTTCINLSHVNSVFITTLTSKPIVPGTLRVVLVAATYGGHTSVTLSDDGNGKIIVSGDLVSNTVALIGEPGTGIPIPVTNEPVNTIDYNTGRILINLHPDYTFDLGGDGTDPATIKFQWKVFEGYDHDVIGVDLSRIFFLDCGLSYSGTPITTVDGLDHLIGETVDVIADGVWIKDQVVDEDGEIELETAASVISVGYRFRSLLQTLAAEGGSQGGTSQGKTKKIDKVDIRLLNSYQLKHGTTLANLIDFPGFEQGNTLVASLFTGDKRIELEDDYGTQASYFIVQDAPFPMNIVALMPQPTTFE